MASKTCFVIAAAGPRTDAVYNTYLAPASRDAGYEPQRSEETVSSQILNNLVNNLTSAQMAIAYLGSPPWNPNVMIEIGYRFGRFNSLVLVCDPAAPDTALNLPFNISDERVFQIPNGRQSKASDQRIIKALSDRISLAAQETRSPVQESPLPVAVLQVSLEKVLKLETWEFVECSAAAAKIMGVDGQLEGKTLKEFYEARKGDMDPRQYSRFMEQQRMLIFALAQLSDDPGEPPPPVADVPIVFSKGPSAGRAYRPIVLTTQQTPRLYRFMMLYADITGGIMRDPTRPDDECYLCGVGPHVPPFDPSVAAANVVQKPRIFLAYPEPMRRFVYKIHEVLAKLGATPWMDKPPKGAVESLEGGVSWAQGIEEAIKQCDAAMVFLHGDIQESFMRLEWLKLLEQLDQRRIKLLPVYMDKEARQSPLPFASVLEGKDFHELEEEGWVEDWLQTISKPNGVRPSGVRYSGVRAVGHDRAVAAFRS